MFPPTPKTKSGLRLLPFLTLLHLTVFGQIQLRQAFQPDQVVHKIPYGAHPTAGRYAQTKDAKIYYEVYGEGPTVVLLHGGLFGSTIEFSEIIDHLIPNYRVVAISTRGHGKSEIGTEPMTLEQRANDAMTVINAVTNDSVTLIGFSDGGFTAYQIGAMYPQRIKKIVAIGAGELVPGIRTFDLSAKQAVEMDKKYWEQQLQLMPEPNRLEDVFSQVTQFYNRATVSKDLLSAIKCPVLVMAGDRDQGNPVERVVSAARHIPNHQVGIIPNAGHVCFGDNFAATWASIAPFLDQPTAQYLPLTPATLMPHQVTYALTKMGNTDVVRVVKDPSVTAVDEPTFVKIKGADCQDCVIKVKVLSKLLPNAPDFARGFIGVAFRINADNSAYESIYIRPTNGRAKQQIRRNHAVQYYSYPNYKFDRLRKESPEQYESYADMALDEWIPLKIVVKGAQAALYIYQQPEPVLVVEDLKLGAQRSGSVGLWVEVGTEGYFKDLKIQELVEK